MKHSLKLALAILAFLFFLVSSASAQSSQSEDKTISFVDELGQTQSITCNERDNICTLSLIVSFKKGTSLITEEIPSKQSTSIDVNGTPVEVTYADKLYSLTTPDSTFKVTKVGDIRKASREFLRSLLKD